jgi:hypothetical protein
MRLEKSMMRTIKKLPFLREFFLERDHLRAQLSQLEFPPGHYSSPHPCIEEIKGKEAEIFECIPQIIPAVDLNDEQQMDLFQKFKEYYKEQPFAAYKKDGVRYFFENPAFGSHDGIILYCFIRQMRPKRIIEVGSGYSSCVILDTNELFFGNISCTLIDPNPSILLSLIPSSDKNRVRMIKSNVQDVGLDLFMDLAADDILLIDSSHVAKINSDVNYIFFDILPRIRNGVYVHFHDIRYPFEYWKEWIYAGRAWNEAYVLRAFLQYNNAFKIQYFSSFMAQFHRDELAKEMPLCTKNTGGSIWIKKVQNP